MENKKYIQVQNLTGSTVVYRIPEDNIRRKFGAFEEKKIPYDELQKLYYQSGGDVLIKDFLCIKDKRTAMEFGVEEESFENEYTWDKQKVDEVLLNGNIDVLHDALDFAPEGIIDLIVSEAVELKIPDTNKRKLIQDCTGKNVNSMINNQIELEKALQTEEPEKPRQRRVVKQETVEKQRRVQETSAVEEESLFGE